MHTAYNENEIARQILYYDVTEEKNKTTKIHSFRSINHKVKLFITELSIKFKLIVLTWKKKTGD